MGAAPGGMPGPRTCMLPSLNPTLIAVDSCRCWTNGFVSSLLHEPPYTEPYVRWCGRTAEVTPPPTRLLLILPTSCRPSSAGRRQVMAGVNKTRLALIDRLI